MKNKPILLQTASVPKWLFLPVSSFFLFMFILLILSIFGQNECVCIFMLLHSNGIDGFFDFLGTRNNGITRMRRTDLFSLYFFFVLYLRFTLLRSKLQIPYFPDMSCFHSFLSAYLHRSSFQGEKRDLILNFKRIDERVRLLESLVRIYLGFSVINPGCAVLLTF